ncbi:imidazole glycerol phosphate synthase subunit HisH [Roseibium album]|uniref:Imidazole glycerol phosphate synthase subunit HisH n=1 Tax=Roseibium album TaxID=311410 RepID=A0A0M7A079_9HYPH|nr:imidazole glycerol phosphate synthase subunit HisH [Roseibium album]CTQ58709.1 Imidazole glycerol phosphate synthase subunit HisH 1 [Roseibium album]CTQ67223.1 Imidazole glycerol phosphate synthase subunit HisH 1 [Roseibium album]CTQ72358.1 Imidazole glycerol phosphate synthase subunit HisH 1 [Roseibium album]
MTIAIIDYGSGNLRSAEKAFERAARAHAHLPDVIVTSDPDRVRKADRIVLPGVGAFADCKRGLWAVDGMPEALEECVRRQGKPFFGICVGMQLMAERGLEFETVEGLGWVEGDVSEMKPADPSLKIPHMGWNTIDAEQESHPVFKGLETGPDGLHAYFVHSYHFACARDENRLATFGYAGTFTAMVAKDNMIGTQFHPEKSQRLGLGLIANFLDWTP